MIKKALLGLTVVMFLFGCQASDQEQFNNPRQMGVHIADQENGLEPTSSQKYGYVRKLKSPNNRQAKSNEIAYLDRHQMANMISTLTVNLPNIDEAATLVTAEEVLIAYKTDAEDRQLTADQVKRTAMAVVPRFYKVYVSDDEDMIDDIERFQNMSTNVQQSDRLLKETIQRMRPSPEK